MRQFGRPIGLMMSVELSMLSLVEDIQPFTGRILADGFDFLEGWSAVYLGVRKSLIAGAILVHNVNHRFW